jgi:hypothetical protein
MDDSLRVRRLEGLGDLRADRYRFGNRDLVLGNSIGERRNFSRRILGNGASNSWFPGNAPQVQRAPAKAPRNSLIATSMPSC